MGCENVSASSRRPRDRTPPGFRADNPMLGPRVDLGLERSPALGQVRRRLPHPVVHGGPCAPKVCSVSLIKGQAFRRTRSAGTSPADHHAVFVSILPGRFGGWPALRGRGVGYADGPFCCV